MMMMMVVVVKPLSFLFLFTIATVVRVPSVEAKVWLAEELAIGEWDVTLRGRWWFDPSRIFPRTTYARSSSRNNNSAEQELPLKRRFWGSSMDCCLSLCQDGTFVLTPAATESLSSSSSSSSKQAPTRLALQGQWNVLSNPYCITDRFYDQLQLKSYLRATKRGSARSAGGRIHLSCRVWGRFAKSKTIGRKGCMTHGTLVWKDDKISSRPRRIVASFSAKRKANEPSHEGWEDQAYFGY